MMMMSSRHVAVIRTMLRDVVFEPAIARRVGEQLLSLGDPDALGFFLHRYK